MKKYSIKKLAESGREKFRPSFVSVDVALAFEESKAQPPVEAIADKSQDEPPKKAKKPTFPVGKVQIYDWLVTAKLVHQFRDRLEQQHGHLTEELQTASKATEESVQAELKLVTMALTRLRKGNYGVCSECQTQGRAPEASLIALQILNNYPAAEVCQFHQQQRDLAMFRSRRAPVAIAATA